jgi:hypothetical protein
MRCEDLSPPSQETIWFHVVDGVGVHCTNCGRDTQKCKACPNAKRCIATKHSVATDAEDGSGHYPEQTYTSTCSHVHCKIKQNNDGQTVTEVKHHHAERYGAMHICQQGLHEDYDEQNLRTACGCECFDELSGDNDWLSGLAKRNAKRVLETGGEKMLYLGRGSKLLRAHGHHNGRAYQGYLIDSHGDTQAALSRHNSDGTRTWLNPNVQFWDGSKPNSNEESTQHRGYANHHGVTMFGYNH